jgi:hypothetical protein
MKYHSVYGTRLTLGSCGKIPLLCWSTFPSVARAQIPTRAKLPKPLCQEGTSCRDGDTVVSS